MAPRGVENAPELFNEDLATGPSIKFVNTDLTSARNEYLFKPPSFIDRWLLSQLRDKRDATIAYLLFNISVTTFPLAIALFFFKDLPQWAGLAYFVTNTVIYMQRYILGLHYFEHLPPFRNTWGGSIYTFLCSTIFCMMYGLPPGTYRLHHIAMHHCENNLFPWDLSSTEPFQRDNLLHFLGYWLRFWFAAFVELPWYAFRRKRYMLAFKSAAYIIVFLLGSRWLYSVRPVATTWVLYVPFLVATLALMFGNWSQHIFVDPARSRNNYALTYNVVNCPDNQKSFNDGYHIIHHVNSKVHWLDLPSRFMETLDKHAEEDAIVFEGLSFNEVGFFAFTGQLGALADRYVNIGQKKRSKDEIVQMLRTRLRPIQQIKKED